MSYLLDALRKAQRERQVGQPPSLQAVDLPTNHAPRPQHRLLLTLAATAVVLLVVVVALLLTRHATPAVAAPAAVSPAPSAAPGAGPNAAGPRSLDELTPTAPAPSESLVAEGEPAPAGAERTAAPAVAPPAPAPVREPIVAEPAEDLPADEPADVPALRELPAAYRSGFPALNIEVHVYDADPARRWIMANTRRYREGESLSEGPRVVEIRPDGVVFEHRGQQALVPVGH